MSDTEQSAPLPTLASPPLVLLAEDDNTSRRFLTDALRELGCDVEACIDGARALVLAAAHRFDLLLLDHRMPRAGAGDVLRRLREDPHARSRRTMAVATSADVTPPLRDELLALGFRVVLAKPVGLDELDALLCTLLPECERDPILLDDVAITRSGNIETMHALRALFVTELSHLLTELDNLAATPSQFADRLHQLRAACGFCGAEALAQHAIRLRMRIDRGDPVDGAAVARFESTVRATLAQLGERN